ncbi:helix-turn-helix domain-containing protein [Paucilactobacillus nenjiangensis]|jgi:transposase|uniref:helix-turn-helix domain-containing protein n=1 Tax=Paucilactobacillus nenjiangensis TaxID=1296540 RepID=UPI003BAFE386
MAKYNIETKIEAIKLYNIGLGTTTIARKLGISKEGTIKNWARSWNKNGLAGITRKNKLPNYSPSFKMKVITWLVEHCASYPETADHFEIPNMGTIWQWKHQYDLHGYEGLSDHRKRVPIMNDKKKLTPSEENKNLKKRLEYLEAENAYLKKLKAVMDQTKKKPKQ